MKKKIKKQSDTQKEQQYQDGQRKRRLQPTGKRPKYKWQKELMEMTTMHLLSLA